MSFRAVDRARSGLNLATARLNAAAHNSAHTLTEGHHRIRVDGAAAADGSTTVRISRAAEAGADPLADAVDRKSAAVAYTANLAVLKAEDEATGELLDLLG